MRGLIIAVGLGVLCGGVGPAQGGYQIHWVTHSSPADNGRSRAAFEKSLEITRAQLDKAVADSLRRIRSRIDDVLRLSGLTKDSISAVFLTGGATRMPSMRKAIAAAVPSARLIAGDAFGSVATGLALDAARRFPAR